MAVADRLSPHTDSQRSKPKAPPGLIHIGWVAGAHGLKGALRIRCDSLDYGALESMARVYIEAAGEVQEYRVGTVTRLKPGHLKVTLEGIGDAQAADILRGGTVMVAVADLPRLGPGEFYYFQVIGCEVMLTDGRRLGVIEDVFATGANDVWVVRAEEAEVLVPVIKDIVKAMDLEACRVTIEPVPGLLE